MAGDAVPRPWDTSAPSGLNLPDVEREREREEEEEKSHEGGKGEAAPKGRSMQIFVKVHK